MTKRLLQKKGRKMGQKPSKKEATSSRKNVTIMPSLAGNRKRGGSKRGTLGKAGARPRGNVRNKEDSGRPRPETFQFKRKKGQECPPSG